MKFLPQANSILSCPKELQRICLKALARDRQERYSSTIEMEEDVEKYLKIHGQSKNFLIRMLKKYKQGIIVAASMLIVIFIWSFSKKSPTLKALDRQLIQLSKKQEKVSDVPKDTSGEEFRNLYRKLRKKTQQKKNLRRNKVNKRLRKNWQRILRKVDFDKDKELSEEEWKFLFYQIDSNLDGQISPKEIQKIIK